MATVTGTAYWASVLTPNTKFEPVYSVDLVIDQATADKFAAKGVPIKQMDEGPAIVIKRKVNKAKGGTRLPPTLVDRRAIPLNAMVGNGSKVKVQYEAFDWEYAGKTGTSLDFVGMQVLELIEYSSQSKAEMEFEDEGVENEELEEL
jgi:hypothetical protein